MLNELLEKLSAITAEAEAMLKAAATAADVENAKNKLTGRNGSLTALAPMMGKIAKEDKPTAGKAFNEAKNAVQAMIEEARERLGGGKVSTEAIDVTLPGRKWPVGRKHPVNQTIDECCAIFRRMGFTVAAGPEIDTVTNCFDALNAPADHPSRDPRILFTSMTGVFSAHRPRQFRSAPCLQTSRRSASFRRDAVSAAIRRTPRTACISIRSKGFISTRMFPLPTSKAHWRRLPWNSSETPLRSVCAPTFSRSLNPAWNATFPVSVQAAKAAASCKNSGWLEILGCGMVNPNVLRNVGINPDKWQGFAFGMGIERLTMLKHRIGDLRLFSDNDLRFLKQF